MRPEIGARALARAIDRVGLRAIQENAVGLLDFAKLRTKPPPFLFASRRVHIRVGCAREPSKRRSQLPNQEIVGEIDRAGRSEPVESRAMTGAQCASRA
jgi:hypothetical protein